LGQVHITPPRIPNNGTPVQTLTASGFSPGERQR
jgi:hypothetical protein